MRFKALLTIALLCSIHCAFGMQNERHTSTWPTIKNKMSLVCRVAKRCALKATKLAIVPFKWAWNNKLGLALMTMQCAAEEYSWPKDGQVKSETMSEKLFLTSLRAYNDIVEGLNKAWYVTYEDESGSFRYYPNQKSLKFNEITQSKPNPDTVARLNVFLQNSPNKLDANEFFQTVGQEASADIIHSLLSPMILPRMRFASLPGPLFLKVVAYLIGNGLLRHGISNGIVQPCMNFVGRIRREGMRRALISLWRGSRNMNVAANLS